MSSRNGMIVSRAQNDADELPRSNELISGWTGYIAPV